VELLDLELGNKLGKMLEHGMGNWWVDEMEIQLEMLLGGELVAA
jgi:hypothetical protein